MSDAGRDRSPDVHFLNELGAPRSVHSLRLGRKAGRGPLCVMGGRGRRWYWRSELEAWATAERAKLSGDRAKVVDMKTVVE